MRSRATRNFSSLFHSQSFSPYNNKVYIFFQPNTIKYSHTRLYSTAETTNQTTNANANQTTNQTTIPNQSTNQTQSTTSAQSNRDLVPQQKTLMQLVLECTKNNLHPNPPEKNRIAEQLQISNSALDICLKQARAEKKRSNPKIIDAREIVIKWLKKNDFQKPNGIEMKNLQKKAGYTKKAFRDLVIFMRLALQGKVDPQQRKDAERLVRISLHTIGYNETHKRVQQIHEQSNLDAQNIRRIITIEWHKAKDRKRFTAKYRLSVAKYLRDRYYRPLTTDEFQELSQVVDSNVEHVQHIVAKHRRQFSYNHLKESMKQMVLDWLEFNNYSYPQFGSVEWHNLQRATELSDLHLNNVLCLLSLEAEVSSSLISKQSYDKLKSWVIEHEYSIPKQPQVNEIAAETQIKPNEALQIIMSMINSKRYTPLNDQAKLQIQKWYTKSNWPKHPSREDLIHLVNDTGCPGYQVYGYAKSLHEKRVNAQKKQAGTSKGKKETNEKTK